MAYRGCLTTAVLPTQGVQHWQGMVRPMAERWRRVNKTQSYFVLTPVSSFCHSLLQGLGFCLLVPFCTKVISLCILCSQFLCLGLRVGCMGARWGRVLLTQGRGLLCDLTWPGLGKAATCERRQGEDFLHPLSLNYLSSEYSGGIRRGLSTSRRGVIHFCHCPHVRFDFNFR